jgi:two-component system, chemotaxis family, chemotaxis protein CheY
MPIIFVVDPLAGVVRTVASGSLAAPDFEAHLRIMQSAGLLGYPQLIDALQAEVRLTEREVQELSEQIKGLHASSGSTRTALVTSDTTLYDMARRYEMISHPHDLGFRVFHQMTDAERWIECASATSPAASDADGGSSRRVLVVEDHPSIRKIVVLTLEAEGFKVESTDRGERARDLALSTAYDLIVTDNRLPDLSGDDLRAIVRRARPAQRFLCISAVASEDDEVPDPGVSRLGKPFSGQQLLTAVRQSLTPA